MRLRKRKVKAEADRGGEPENGPVVAEKARNHTIPDGQDKLPGAHLYLVDGTSIKQAHTAQNPRGKGANRRRGFTDVGLTTCRLGG